MRSITPQRSISQPTAAAGTSDPEVTVQMGATGLTGNLRTTGATGTSGASVAVDTSAELLHRQLGVDVRGVDVEGVTPKPVFTALKDSEYRLRVPVHTDARNFKIRLLAKKAWALASAQLWSSVRRIDAPVASAGDVAARGADPLVAAYTSPVVSPTLAVANVSTDVVAAPATEALALRTALETTPVQPLVVDAITLVPEYAETIYTSSLRDDQVDAHRAYGAGYMYRRPADLAGDMFMHPPVSFPAASLPKGSKYDPNTPVVVGNTGYHPVAPWQGRIRFSTPDVALTHMRLYVDVVIAWPSDTAGATDAMYQAPMYRLYDVGAGALYRHIMQMVSDFDAELAVPRQTGSPRVVAYAPRIRNMPLVEVYNLVYELAAAVALKRMGSPMWMYQLPDTQIIPASGSVEATAQDDRRIDAAERIIGYRPPVVRVAGYGPNAAEEFSALRRAPSTYVQAMAQPSSDELPPRRAGQVGTFADVVVDLRGNIRTDVDAMPRLDARVVGNVGGQGFIAYLQPVERELGLGVAHASPVESKSYVVTSGGAGSVTASRVILGYGGNISTYTYMITVPAGSNMNVELELQDASSYGIVFGIDRACAELVYDPTTASPASLSSSSIPTNSSSSSSSSSLMPIESSLSSSMPAVTKLVLRSARRAWPTAWYTEVLQGIPGDEWQSPVVEESSEGADTGYTANVLVSASDSADKYMGPFGNTYVRLSLANVPTHTQLVVGVELFIKGPWRGSSEAAPHMIGIRRIGGAVRDELWQASIATVPGTTQSFPSTYSVTTRVPAGSGADELGTLFYDTPSGIFVAEFDLDHGGDSIVLEIYGKNLPEDCTWGVARAYVKTGHVYAVNEAFDAADFPQALVSYADMPALVVGRALLGSGFKSDLIFVNKALPVTLYKDSLGDVRSLRFPVYGLADDVERFWQVAESVFESSPARAFDCRSERVGFATEDKYPKYLNPMAVLLGHVMAGNLLILKLAATGDTIPISVFNALRKRLPTSCGLLLHTEIETETAHAMGEAAVETFDVIDVETSMTWVGRPAVRVWAGDAAQAIPIYRANGDLIDDGVYVALDTGTVISQADLAVPIAPVTTDVPGFSWWQHTNSPFIHVARWPDAGSLVVAIWPAGQQEVSALVLVKGADVAGVTVPAGGQVTVEAGVLRLTCASGTLTAPQEFVIRWSIRTALMSEAAIITGYTG